MKRYGPVMKKYSSGGYLVGPSHENGGIRAIVDGTEPIELEGGEYIINAQTVNALGVPFLDKLNSTQTTYHTGGFGPNQLPNPSSYKRGGNIRKYPHGGTTKSPRGNSRRRWSGPMSLVTTTGPKGIIRQDNRQVCPNGMAMHPTYGYCQDV